LSSEKYLGKYTIFITLHGLRGAAFGRGTALQAGRTRFRLPMRPLKWVIDLLVPVALWPWGRLRL